MRTRREAPVVETAQGRLRGTWKSKGAVAVFRGVRYAAPPIGERRWRAPEPAESWDGVRDALKDGPTAYQRGAMIHRFMDALFHGQGWRSPRVAAISTLAAKAPTPPESEDCLHLTVRTPTIDPTAALPVMVWIHGGDHQDGAGSEAFYASNALAQHDVVTVSINYRLGLLGYFAHPELTAESEHGVAGNYGTLDQIAALEWVRDNITAFGGDRGNVTIFGESAGGESVLHMMTSPLARGLFHRAIAQSPANSGQLIHLRRPFLDYDSAEQTGLDVAKALGVVGPNQIERLRALPAEELRALAQAAPRLGDHYPTIDGHVLPESPLAAFAGGRQAPVPFIVGTNADEGSLISPAMGWVMVEYRYRPIPEDGLQPEIAAAFGDDAARLVELYPGLDRRDPRAEIDFNGDHMFGGRAYWCARHHQANGHPTWLYRFARTPPSPRQTAGAYHGAELPFVHGSNVPILPLTDDDKALAAEMQRIWTSFARTGDPNPAAASAMWPAFDSASPTWLVFDHEIRPEPVDRVERYAILNSRTERLVAEMAARVD